MRKPMGKDDTQPVRKPQPLKTGAEPDRSEPTLSERLNLQMAQAAAAGPQAGAAQYHDASRYSVVGQSMVIEGDLEAAEDLMIAGRLEGSLKHTANSLIVAKTGVVTGDVHAQNLIVEGRIVGDIDCAGSVALKSTAHVTGDIHTAALSIADGAQFNGKVVMVSAKPG